MATFSPPRFISGLQAAADYTATSNLYRAVVSNGTDFEVVIATTPADQCVGILMNSPDINCHADVAGAGGGAKAVAGGVVTAGDPLTNDASGALVVAATTEYAFARAAQAAVAGDIFHVEIVDFYVA